MSKQAKERVAQLVQRAESDGSLVLVVTFPSIQESKRIKLDSSISIKEAKKQILLKFQTSLSPNTIKDMDYG